MGEPAVCVPPQGERETRSLERPPTKDAHCARGSLMLQREEAPPPCPGWRRVQRRVRVRAWLNPNPRGIL